MTKQWKFEQPLDKLNIFVSSRIGECAEERKSARKAITSLNHNPVLFEHLGARPYPPRDLYLSRLSTSHAMVAVYKDGYGFIDTDNGMTISGLEDEFRYAQHLGIETLFYVCKLSSDRDVRLKNIIEQAEGKYTLSYYTHANELEERIRDDLTALVSRRYASKDAEQDLLNETPDRVLAMAKYGSGIVIDRPSVMEGINSLLKQEHEVCICGPAGIGKSIIASQFSEFVGALFVRATNLSPKEIFSACAIRLKNNESEEVLDITTLHGAHFAFCKAWKESNEFTLVLDECDYIQEILAAVHEAGGLTNKKRLVYTSRDCLGESIYNVPPFTRNQMEVFAEHFGVVLDEKTIETGNPLHVHEMLLCNEISTAGFPKSELLYYLGLASAPLTSKQLISLKGDESYSVEQLYDDIGPLHGLVEDSPRGFRIMHAEIADRIQAELSKSPQKLQFYVTRLMNLYGGQRNFIKQYEMARLLRDGNEHQYAVRALRDAAKFGNWKLGVEIADGLLERAVTYEEQAETFKMLLTLVYPLELMGNTQRADELLNQADALSSNLGEWAQKMVLEQKTVSRARSTLSKTDVEQLVTLYTEADEAGDEWNQARLGIEISALFIAANRFQDAIEILRPSLEIFKEFGDDYGIDVAERNLAASLSALPGNDTEAERLIKKITDRTRSDTDKRRQKAWYNNILCRKYRAAGRYNDAIKLAAESISIGQELGDEQLQAINLINLGNAHADKGDWQQAIKSYQDSALAAQRCKRRDIEADASRLTATVYNDADQSFGNPTERANLSQIYAEAAIGLTHDGIKSSTRARALVELGRSFVLKDELARAAQAFFSSASAFKASFDMEEVGVALQHAVDSALPDNIETYINGLADVFDLDINSEMPNAEQLARLTLPIIKFCPENVLISILGGHLNLLFSLLPPLARTAILIVLAERFRDWTKSTEEISANRTLYSAIVFAAAVKDQPVPYLYTLLGYTLHECITELSVRELEENARIWTVVLNCSPRVTVTVFPFDGSLNSNLSALAIAAFLKAFENQLIQELIGDKVAVSELCIQIISEECMPEDLKENLSNLRPSDFGVDEFCSVTRPTAFDQQTPTFVFLSKNFSNEITFGQQRGGSLQVLLGYTLIEIVFQLLKGEVNADEIAPKIKSIVQQTLS